MTKKFKRLTAMTILLVTTMSSATAMPIFAKSGDRHYNEILDTWFIERHIDGEILLENEKTGLLSKKGSMKEIANYISNKDVGIVKANVIVKDGVSMVSVKELAEVMELDCEEVENAYDLTGYDEGGGILTGMYIYLPESGRKIDYLDSVTITHDKSHTVNPAVEIKFAPKNTKFELGYSYPEHVNEKMTDNLHTSVTMTGKFSTRQVEYINGILYVPAKEVINLINQENTEITYDKTSKMISFEKKMKTYLRTFTYVPR